VTWIDVILTVALLAAAAFAMIGIGLVTGHLIIVDGRLRVRA
jgi:hypothetical protein